MSKPSDTPGKIAFIFDDRLPPDRKAFFHRTVSQLESHFGIEVLPSSTTEDEMVARLEKTEYSLILLPWYKYLSWRKVESHYGALRLEGHTVAGYFADAILPFEFTSIPNYHRCILLDFYRFDQAEIEFILQGLIFPDLRSGLTGIFSQQNPVHYSEWFNHDGDSTRCVDSILRIPMLQSSTWLSRFANIRLYLTALWTLCFQQKHSLSNNEPCAEFEISEYQNRLAVRLKFESNDLTLKQMMGYLWPTTANPNPIVRELTNHSDFIRVQHFPESHGIEITAFFIPSSPCSEFPGEVRGFWIEPLKQKFMKTTDQHLNIKRIPIRQSPSEILSENLQAVVDILRGTLMNLHDAKISEKSQAELQINVTRAILTEIEKRVAEKKKVA